MQTIICRQLRSQETQKNEKIELDINLSYYFRMYVDQASEQTTGHTHTFIADIKFKFKFTFF
jgi:hypothetical protein